MAQDILADGFVKLCIDPSLNFYDGACRVLVEGPMTTGTATVDTLVSVPTTRDLETLFGTGSILTETLKKVFCQCPSGIEIQAIGRADPGSAVKATHTLTFTGPATADGRIELFMLDRDYAIDVYIASGQTATQIAATVLAAISPDLPFVVTAAAGVLTFTARSAGVSGNYLNVIYNWRGLVNYAPPGVTATFAHAVAGTGDLTALNYDNLIGNCCFSCFILLGESDPYQHAWQLYLESKWDCNDPQCFGHGYTYNTGSLGQILARGTNAGVFSRKAHCQGDPSPPYFQAAAYGALSCCTACTSPELSIQGRNDGVLDCLKVPESCTQCFTFDEQTQLKDAGFVVTGPYSGGSGQYTSPYVFNDVTNYLYDSEGRPNLTFRDTNSRRLTAATAIAIATFLSGFSSLALFTKNTNMRQGTFGTTVRLLLAAIRAWSKDQVGILFSEFTDIDRDIQLKTDFEVSRACAGNPNNLWLFYRYRPPVRLGKIITTLQPKILDNCDR